MPNYNNSGSACIAIIIIIIVIIIIFMICYSVSNNNCQNNNKNNFTNCENQSCCGNTWYHSRNGDTYNGNLICISCFDMFSGTCNNGNINIYYKD